MLNLRPFQIIVLAVFAVLAVLAIVLLSGFSPGTTSEDKRFGNRVEIWGTLPERNIKNLLGELERSDRAFEVIEYRYVDPRNFNAAFVNAIAEGRSPDMVLLPNTAIARERSKLLAISYDTFPLRQFKDAYIDGAEIFALRDGVYAIPFAVDPLIMFWNRDIFSSNGLAVPPTTWEALVNSTVPTLRKVDSNRNVTQAALAFGENRNVQNGKAVLLLLATQSGSRLVREEENRYIVDLNRSISGAGLPPLEAAVQFYTNFNNPNNALYTWNRSLPLDRNAFVSGDLALYFGFGSEVATIRTQNPNLNFDVAPVPQGAGATVRRTYGDFYGFAIPKASANASGAYRVALALTTPQISSPFVEALNLASVSRSVLAGGSSDVFRQVISTEALIDRSWLDPNPVATDEIFQAMIEDVSSGRKSVNESIRDGESRIRQTF